MSYVNPWTTIGSMAGRRLAQYGLSQAGQAARNLPRRISKKRYQRLLNTKTQEYIPRPIRTRNVRSRGAIRRTLGFEPETADNWSISSLPQQELNVYQLRFPPSAVPSGGALNESYANGLRTGPRILLKGLRLWMELDSKSRFDIEVHFAFVQKISPTLGFTTAEFFTDNIVGQPTNKAFIDGTAQGYAEYQRYMKINSDRHHILEHKKIMLGPLQVPGTLKGTVASGDTDLTSSSGVTAKQANNKVLIDKYYKINQVFEFDAPGNSSPDKELVFLMWYTARNIEDFGKLNSETNDLNTTAIVMSSRYQMYYHNMD